MLHGAIISDANKMVLDQFGLINHRLRITYVSRSAVYISADGTATERAHQGANPQANRKEKYLYSSVDKQKKMSITLDIRNERLFCAEIEASLQTLPAGEMWSEKIMAAIPRVKVLINGREK